MGGGGRQSPEKPPGGMRRIPGRDVVQRVFRWRCSLRSLETAFLGIRAGVSRPVAELTLALCFADFTRDVAAKYVRRGLSLLFEHFLTLLLVPLAGFCLVSVRRCLCHALKLGHLCSWSADSSWPCLQPFLPFWHAGSLHDQLKAFFCLAAVDHRPQSDRHLQGRPHTAAMDGGTAD